jgi:DMSO/TMAO reductase YedYZ molybdopterin-dependent catalytic subunit
VTRRELLSLPAAGLLIRSASAISDPQNISYPLRGIQGSVTAPDLFFVRDHFSEPDISLEGWKLRIEGRVDRPYEVNFSDLVELPTTKLEAVLECAGNVTNGSAVSNGIWEGVPLSSLIKSAQPSSAAGLAMLEGADSGRLLQDTPHLQYSQVVPLDKCMDAASLVAFKLNDLLLPKRNGFPVRALFPGWYGMDSVKWLQRIVVMNVEDQPQSTFHRSGMSRLYNRVTNVQGDTRVTRVSSIQVKSVVAWPPDGLKLPAGQHIVWGFAWAGTAAVRSVTVTTDGGKEWSHAKLEAQSGPYSWVRWNYSWNARPGDHTLMSRASDAAGGEQPLNRDPARKDGYELNSCMPLRCSVL